jgi:hypothetical protein
MASIKILIDRTILFNKLIKVIVFIDPMFIQWIKKLLPEHFPMTETLVHNEEG